MGKDFFHSDEIPIRILHREPQHEYPMHTHDFSELVLVLDGEGTHFTKKNNFRIGRGNLFVINGDQAHGYKELNNLILINILFDLKKMSLPELDIGQCAGFHTLFTVEPLLREVSPFYSRLIVDEYQIDAIYSIVSKMEHELNVKEQGYNFMATSLFMQMLTFISRIYSRGSGSSQSSLYNLGQTISFMENNLNRSPGIKELCDISHMSESSLLRAFKKITGTSPLNYHLKKRIDAASLLLRNNNSSITMVAYDMGFSDSNYFSRQFKKMKGISPREFRKRSQF